MPTRLAHVIGVISNVATIMAATIVTSFVAVAFINTHQWSGSSRGGTSSSAVGSLAPPVPGLDYGRATQTIVLIVRTSCPYCTESLDAFNELCQRAAQTGGTIRSIVIGAEDKAILEEYLATHGVHVDGVYSVPNREALTGRTPRLLIVGSNRLIYGEWLGRLDASVGSQVAQALDALE